MQVGAAVGTVAEVEGMLTVEEVFVDVADVVMDVEVDNLVEDTVVEREVEVEMGVLVLEPAAGVRYQFAGGSPRHSPAVTPFQPFCWMRPK